jgi:hypothetical protein
MISNVEITNTHDVNYFAFGLDILSNSSVTAKYSVTNSVEEAMNMPLSSNLTGLTNSSNVTSLNSNITNKSSSLESNVTNKSNSLNTTIPEQLPPEVVNGSKIGKI